MDDKSRKRAWMGVISGLGVVVALGGFVGHYYSAPTTIVATFGIWIVGATLVNLLAG